MKDYERITSYMTVGSQIVAIMPQRRERIQAYIDRLFDLEDKIERGEIDYVADSETGQTITDLLIEFDEMGFAPTTVCENPEQYAIDWRERVRKEFAHLTAENKAYADNILRAIKILQNSDGFKAQTAINQAIGVLLGNKDNKCKREID